MEIIASIIGAVKTVISIILLILILIYKKFKQMKKIIGWFKSLFNKKQQYEQTKTSSIPDPRNPPPKGRVP